MSYLLLTCDYFLHFLDDSCLTLLSSFQTADKSWLPQAEYNEEAYLDLVLYFVLFQHKAAISTRWCFFFFFFFFFFFHKIFFIRLWNIVRKITLSTVGLHIYHLPFTLNCKKSRIRCFGRSSLVLLLKIKKKRKKKCRIEIANVKFAVP